MIAVALSMDAFSLALLYGTLGMPLKKRIELSIIVGIYHFFMPILGYFFGKLIFKTIPISPNILVGIIFLLLGLQMLQSLKKKEKVEELLTIYALLLFGFTVSIDSFSVGITLNTISNKIFLGPLVFSIISAFFTYMGTTIGKLLNYKFGIYATLIGAIILIFLSFSYLFS